MIISEIILVVAVIVAVLGYLYERTKITKINTEEQAVDYDPLKTVKDLEGARKDIEIEKRNYQSLLEKTQKLRDEFKKKEEFVDFLKDAKKRGKDNIVLYEIEREMIQDEIKRKADSFATFSMAGFSMAGIGMEGMNFYGKPVLSDPYTTNMPTNTESLSTYHPHGSDFSRIDEQYYYKEELSDTQIREEWE